MNEFGIRRRHRQPASAIEMWMTLDHHGLTGSGTIALLGGFVLLHGHGDCPPIGSLCSIVGLDDGMLVVAEVGAKGRTFLPYRNLLGLEVGGHGLIQQDAGMVGWGTSLLGVARGVATARMINRATRKTTNDCFLRISTAASEMVFGHCQLPPQAVRAGLGRAFVGHMAATRQANAFPASAPMSQPETRTPIDELERLTKLHAAGTLTDTEFQRARDIQVRRLQEQS